MIGFRRHAGRVIGNASKLSSILDKLGVPKGREPKQPDEFTIADVMDERGLSIDIAGRFLRKCLKEGTLTRRPFGNAGYLYRAT